MSNSISSSQIPKDENGATQKARELGHAYFRELDGLRTFCVILTVLGHIHHVPWFINGLIGVDIFFALSGFLITFLLHRETTKRGNVCLVCFYIRRVFRIVPMYYLTLVLYLALSVALRFETGDPKRLEEVIPILPWALAFCTELRPADLGGTLMHTWTLGIEEKYYILWPLLFVVATGKVGQRIRWAALLALAATMLLAFYPSFNLFRGFGGLMAGSLMALAIVDEQLPIRKFIMRVPTHIWFAGMVLGYVTATLIHDHHAKLLVALPAAPFIAAIVLKPRDPYKSFLSLPVIWHLGLLTYSLYLTHLMVLNAIELVLPKLHMTESPALMFVLGYPAAVLLAYVLHKLVEQPFIHMGKNLSDRYSHARAARLTTG